MVEVKVDVEKCDGDGTCVDTCPVDVFEIREGKAVVVNLDECLICRVCEIECPNNAIEVIE